jgi:hypothetical protein
MPSTTATLRRQVAIVRSILDEMERWLAPGTSADSVRVQLLEELSRLEGAARAWLAPGRQPGQDPYGSDAIE